jgi:hypothetical protein
MKTIKHYKDIEQVKHSDKIAYLKYRTNKIKHELWLRSRKSNNVYITSYDQHILDHLGPGPTAIFGSAGYYLEDCVDDLTVIEKDSIVKKFYPKAVIVDNREDIGKLFPARFKNFIVTNNRSDMWCDAQGLKAHIEKYRTAMAPDCLFFYSIRDTQFTPWNRLKINHYKMFVDLAKQIENIGFECLQTQIDLANGDGNENPDTTNGNIRYIFRCIK